MISRKTRRRAAQSAVRWWLPRLLWSRLDTGWRLAIGLLLTQRLVLGLAGVAAEVLAHDRRPEGGLAAYVIQGGEPWSLFLSTWQRWDALWYQAIVEEGYGPPGDTLNFYPLYPLLSRALAFILGGLGGRVVLAELAVSSVCFVVAMRLLYDLASTPWLGFVPPTSTRTSPPPSPLRQAQGRLSPVEGEGRKLGRRAGVLAVLLVALFPTGFFLFAPFTESLFLMLTVGCFWLAHRQRWWLAGGAGALAALARANGLALVFPLGFEYLRSRGAVARDTEVDGRGDPPQADVARGRGMPRPYLGQWRAPGWAFIAVAGPLAGAAGWALYSRSVAGEGRAGLTLVERALGRALAAAPGGDNARAAVWRFVPPWETLWAGLQQAWQDLQYALGTLPVPLTDTLPGVEILNLAALIGFSVLGVVALWRLPPQYSLYLWPNLIILLTRRIEATTPLESASRYVLVLFPCFILVAQLLARRLWVAVPWLAASAGLQLLLFQAFVRWRFIA